MSVLLLPSTARKAIRRAATLRCEAVSLDRFRMLGVRALDLSASGILLAADELAIENEAVLVHIFHGDLDIAAEAEVARVVRGERVGDRGPALGLRLTRVPGRRFGQLLRRLRGTPPPIPTRRLRVDYARTVRETFLDGLDGPPRPTP